MNEISEKRNNIVVLTLRVCSPSAVLVFFDLMSLSDVIDVQDNGRLPLLASIDEEDGLTCVEFHSL